MRKKAAVIPPGLRYIYVTQALLMVGTMFISVLLVLNLTNHYGFSDNLAYALYAAFSALLFSGAIFGGTLGSFFSHRNTAFVGFGFAALGLLLLSIKGLIFIYLGLSFYLIGISCCYPNINCAVGQIYNDGDPARVQGFTYVYIGMNVGAVAAGFSAGYIVRYISYSFAFIVALIAVLFAGLVYYIGFPKLKFKSTTHIYKQLRKKGYWQKDVLSIVLISLVTVIATIFFLKNSNFANSFMILVAVGITTFMIKLSQKLPQVDKLRMLLCILLLVLSIGFWALYALAPSALAVFISRHVERQIYTIVLPTSMFLSLNPVFIIIVGYFLELLWGRLAAKKIYVSPIVKFVLGTLSMCLGYLILAVSIYTSTNGMINGGWIVLSSFLQSTAELLIAPVSFAMIGHMVQSKYEGSMLGYAQLITGAAGALSSFLAKDTHSAKSITLIKSAYNFQHAFFIYSGYAFAVFLLLCLLTPYFNKNYKR